MLTGKQKRFLRGQAHGLKSIFHLGKGGIGENFIEQVNLALEARELIKISILQNCEEDRYDLADNLSQTTNSELVQVLGKTIVLYRKSTNSPQIVLPSINKISKQ
jgi:RNA-binding protein